MLTIGLVVNPNAGVGGPAGMKGSDGAEAQSRARELGVVAKALDRASEVFVALAKILGPGRAHALRVLTPAGTMGRDAFDADRIPGGSFSVETFSVETFSVETLAEPQIVEPTSAVTTKAAVRALLGRVDLLVFVGGDGTARDVLDAWSQDSHQVPVLGVPAGVKMHSGVFATSPDSAARLLALLIDGDLVAAEFAEVRDIDEAALRRGVIGSNRYGEMLVPSAGGYLQHVKSGGKEVEALVLLEIAAEVEELFCSGPMADQLPLVLGPGSTCFAIKEKLLAETSELVKSSSEVRDPTLLGVDVVHRGRLLVGDASANELMEIQSDWPGLSALVSFSRGQGFVLGRGNQQLSPEFLTRLAPNALHIVSSRTKLLSLEGRPLLADSGSVELDERFSGLQQIISGYEDRLLYLVQPA